MFKNVSIYIKKLLEIAFPIILGNIGFIMIGVGDVIVAGRHSTDTLAAVSLATAIINCITIMGIGVLGSISPILSINRGANKEPEKYFYPSLKFALIVSVIMSSVILGTMPLVDKLGFEAHLTPLVKDYFFITAFSTFGAYLHYMSKEFLQAFEIVVFPNLLTIFCIFLNIVLNLIFAFGYGPIPEMGVKGLAIASLLVRYFMGIVLLIYCYKKINIKYHKDKEYYKEMLKVGLPSSLAIMIEFVAFNSITVIMGRVSGIYAAAQNIVCTITSISFMVPLAIGNAAGVKVGFSNGAKLYQDLKKYAITALSMSAGFMACSAVVIAIAPGVITSLFTKDTELIKVCVPIIYTLCFFQVFDGVQATLAGIFRGLKHTEVIMGANFIAFWLVAIPLGCLLALHFKLNLIGFWYALIVSTIILCTIVLVNLIKRFKEMDMEGEVMPHFFVDSRNRVNNLISIDDNENYRHIAKVLRARVGEKLLLVDEAQIQYETKIVEINSNEIVCQIEKSYPSKRDLDFDLYLAQSPLRSDAQLTIMEKATELGVRGVYPVITDNCALNKSVLEKKHEKWQKVMYEASKQCERAKVPTCFEPTKLDNVLEQEFDKVMVLAERSTEISFKQYLMQNPIKKGEKVLVIIGPEGGFSQKEFEYFKTKALPLISLGDLILKAETAVIVTLGDIVYEYQG